MAKAKAGNAAQLEVVNVPAPGQLTEIVEDSNMVQEAGKLVLSFLGQVAGFFRKAGEIEQHAIEMLDAARLLEQQPPKTEADDAAVQVFIKQTSAATKAAEEHWEITSVVSRFHRRLTAARARATTKLEAANKIGNRLHNNYAEEARRAAAAEQERIRRENEIAAERERQELIAKQEAEIVRLEEASLELSGRETTFVAKFCAGYSAQDAAKAAGYKDAVATAARLLSKEKIKDAIKATRDAEAMRRQVVVTKAAPVVYDEPVVAPAITKKGIERTTWAGELLDQEALMAAFKAGTFGIPDDVWQVNPVKLNEYARALQGRLNHWPGVKAVSTTKVI